MPLNRVLACRLGPLDLIRPHFFPDSMQCREGGGGGGEGGGAGDGCMGV